MASLSSNGVSAAMAVRAVPRSRASHSMSPAGRAPHASVSAMKNRDRSPDAEAASGQCVAMPSGESATWTTEAGDSFWPNEP